MAPSDLLRYVAHTLERLGLRYLVTGSTATIAYGEPRFTIDIDVVVDLPFDRVSELYAHSRRHRGSRGYRVLGATLGPRKNLGTGSCATRVLARSGLSQEILREAVRVVPTGEYFWKPIPTRPALDFA